MQYQMCNVSLIKCWLLNCDDKISAWLWRVRSSRVNSSCIYFLACEYCNKNLLSSACQSSAIWAHMSLYCNPCVHHVPSSSPARLRVSNGLLCRTTFQCSRSMYRPKYFFFFHRQPESDKSAVCGFGGRCKPQPWGYQRENNPCQLHTPYIFQSSSIFISCSSCSSFRQSNSTRHLTAFHSEEIYFQGTMILQIYLLPLNVTNNIGIPSYQPQWMCTFWGSWN